MSLELYYHPFSSFCWKVLIALYENDTTFEPHLVDLGDEGSRARFLAMWPIGKFPVIRDGAVDRIIPESTIIIEYLAQARAGKAQLIPDSQELALEARFRDRFYDAHVHVPMQKIVGDRLRPAGSQDAVGVDEAKARIETAYRWSDRDMTSKTWAVGEEFTIADCAAAPALYYANRVVPLGDEHRNVAAYLGRLLERPSFARVVKEAEPYSALFPT